MLVALWDGECEGVSAALGEAVGVVDTELDKEGVALAVEDSDALGVHGCEGELERDIVEVTAWLNDADCVDSAL